ncbi:MAG: hypothetical protein HW387_1147 [Parachlamydiales bacterium]|nr:hypothetical protein [Parachlamydiales bacterium]
MSLTIHLCIAAIVGTITAIIASKRGHNPYFWFAIGFLFGILGLIAIFIAPLPKKKPPPAPPAPVSYIDGPIDRFWYYLDEARLQKGPMSHNALTQAWKKGEIPVTTLVWHEDLPNWKELQELIKNKS